VNADAELIASRRELDAWIQAEPELSDAFVRVRPQRELELEKISCVGFPPFIESEKRDFDLVFEEFSVFLRGELETLTVDLDRQRN
jgi:hypothetical protein